MGCRGSSVSLGWARNSQLRTVVGRWRVSCAEREGGKGKGVRKVRTEQREEADNRQRKKGDVRAAERRVRKIEIEREGKGLTYLDPAQADHSPCGRRDGRSE